MPITRNMKDMNVIDVSGSSNDPLLVLLEEDQDEQEPYTSQDELNELKDYPFVASVSESFIFPPKEPGQLKTKEDVLLDVTSSGLSKKQLDALEALLNQSIGETHESIAKRAGVTRMSLYRWLNKDKVFRAIYDEQLRSRFVSSKAPQWLRALNKAAVNIGEPGQVSAAKILAEIHGLLKGSGSSVNVDINNVNTVNGNETIPLDLLPTWLKLVIIKAVQGATISRELENRIINELSEGLTLNGSNVSPEYMLSEEEQEEHETGTENDIHLISANDYHDSNDDNVNDNNSGMLF